MTKREAERARRRRQRRLQSIKEAVIATIVIILFLLLVGKLGDWEHHYHREGKVISVIENVVTVEDKVGYLWEFEGVGYRKGDRVDMYMFTNYTHEVISDDEIEEVKLVTTK